MCFSLLLSTADLFLQPEGVTSGDPENIERVAPLVHSLVLGGYNRLLAKSTNVDPELLHYVPMFTHLPLLEELVIMHPDMLDVLRALHTDHVPNLRRLAMRCAISNIGDQRPSVTILCDFVRLYPFYRGLHITVFGPRLGRVRQPLMQLRYLVNSVDDDRM